jgi:hypothetical protein
MAIFRDGEEETKVITISQSYERLKRKILKSLRLLLNQETYQI